jgi:hypothetical protein
VSTERSNADVGADAVVVVDGSADDVIAQMLADGWTLQPGVDRVAGKRIRYLQPPAQPAAGEPPA